MTAGFAYTNVNLAAGIVCTNVLGMNRARFLSALTFPLAALLAGQSALAQPLPITEGVSEVRHPAWSKSATIYEVNIRQYTPEGTFRAFEQHLPRIRRMGVDVLWIMPINPIAKKERKGSLGSYYAVSDYLAVNPEYGDLGRFQASGGCRARAGLQGDC